MTSLNCNSQHWISTNPTKIIDCFTSKEHFLRSTSCLTRFVLHFGHCCGTDVFGLLPATRGNTPERTKMTAKIQPSGQGRGRVTADREKSMGGDIIPASAHHRGERVWGKTIPVSTYLLPLSPPPPSYAPTQNQRGRGGGSQPADP